ncbi:MAG TPA: branched-chain amino acid ABC transporter permease [Solirubrobacteraceae bacterium]|nr:branched-chain amino acid ABC transporter permease [Solirubrobacteraceae bacterium]
MSTTVLLHSIGFGITTAAVVAIGAMGFTLQLGVTNILNLSYGNVMTIGAFASLIAERSHLGLAATILVAPLAGAVVTWVLARTLFALYARRHGGAFDLLMVSLAVALIIQYGIDALAHLQVFQFSFPAGATLNVGPFVFTVLSLALVGFAAVVLAALLAALHLTRLGKALRALSVDPRLARACGVPMRRMLDLTWLVSGALAGLAGLVYVTNSLTVDAGSGLDFLVLVIAAAMLGGAGSPAGAVLAALVVGIASEVVAAIGGSYYSDAAGLAILALVLVLRPAARTLAHGGREDVTV